MKKDITLAYLTDPPLSKLLKLFGLFRFALASLFSEFFTETGHIFSIIGSLGLFRELPARGMIGTLGIPPMGIGGRTPVDMVGMKGIMGLPTPLLFLLFIMFIIMSISIGFIEEELVFGNLNEFKINKKRNEGLS